MSETTLPVEVNPMGLIAQALDKNLDLDKLEKLFDLEKRWKTDRAKEMYFDALSKAQDEFPNFDKTKKVDFNSRNGGRVKYNFAPLDEIVKKAKPVLSKHGLSYHWKTTTENDLISVTCISTHKDGHTESCSFSAPIDTSGNKDAIKGAGSTITYLQRYTFNALHGIVTGDEDIDGEQPGKDNRNITPEQKQLAEKYVNESLINISEFTNADDLAEKGDTYIANAVKNSCSTAQINEIRDALNNKHKELKKRAK